MSLRDRLARALAEGARAPAATIPGDVWGDAPLTPAAVLVPVTDRAEPGVILTRRTEHMRSHPGQIAFPGGRIDPDDDGPVAAALREAEEEIGLPRGLPDVVGTLGDYATTSHYAVTPVLAVVPPDLRLVGHAHEVAEIFEVPLAYLLDTANHIEHEISWQGRPRRIFEIAHDGRRIWGVTAALIVNLGRRLAGFA